MVFQNTEFASFAVNINNNDWIIIQFRNLPPLTNKPSNLPGRRQFLTACPSFHISVLNIYKVSSACVAHNTVYSTVPLCVTAHREQHLEAITDRRINFTQRSLRSLRNHFYTSVVLFSATISTLRREDDCPPSLYILAAQVYEYTLGGTGKTHLQTCLSKFFIVRYKFKYLNI